METQGGPVGYFIDQASVVEGHGAEYYRLRAVHWSRTGLRVKKGGTWSGADPAGQYFSASDLPGEIVEWSPGQLLLPVDMADDELTPLVSMYDLEPARLSVRSTGLTVIAKAQAGRAWNYSSWGDKGSRGSQARLALLRESLALAKGQRKNEEALSKIVDKSIDARFVDLAQEATRLFGSMSSMEAYWAVRDLFRDPYNWRKIDNDFADWCERVVLEGRPIRSNGGWGGHFSDFRSEALGQLAKYRFFTGANERAIELWDAATDKFDRDEAIGEAALLIGEHAANRLDEALGLADLITARTRKARLLAQLSEYA